MILYPSGVGLGNSSTYLGFVREILDLENRRKRVILYLALTLRPKHYDYISAVRIRARGRILERRCGMYNVSLRDPWSFADCNRSSGSIV